MLDGLSLFFPCHNEEAHVRGLLEDALRIARETASSYDITIVDDGSTDHTADIVDDFVRRKEPVRLVRHPHCLGYGEALKSGFRAARYPWVFYSDGDRQFDLAELPRLTAKADDQDIVSGYRSHRADPWHRRLNAKIYALALRMLMGLDVPDTNCAFKLYRREMLDRISIKTSGAMINAEIFLKAKRAGGRIAWVPVTHKPRTAGRQTGAQPKVILKAMREFLHLWWDLRFSHETA